MSTFPGSPRLFKGAIVGINPKNIPTSLKSANVILFQYNPETMTRQVEARSINNEDGSNRYEPYRLIGPPKETMTLEIELDATDQLAKPSQVAIAMGVHPSLAALEMLLYPKVSKVKQNLRLEAQGNIEIIPPEAPLTLFIWGEKRVLPVRLSSFSINEQAYDPRLNPIRAKVSLTLQVLSYFDLERESLGAKTFLVHQTIKEKMATANKFNSYAQIASAITSAIFW